MSTMRRLACVLATSPPGRRGGNVRGCLSPVPAGWSHRPPVDCRPVRASPVWPSRNGRASSTSTTGATSTSRSPAPSSGMNDFCNKTVDVRRDRHLVCHQQSICTTSQVPYPFQYMPDVAGGLAFEYNLTGAERPADQEPHPERPDAARDLHRLHQELEQPGHRCAQPRHPPAEPADHGVLPQRPLR